VLDALFPEMSRLSASAEGMQRLRRLFHDAGRMMLGGALLLSIAGGVGARACLVLLYGSAGGYEQAVPVLRVLVWAVPAMFLYLLGGHTLYALGRQRQVTLVMLVVGIANIAANLWVIPRWSYLGAGVVALLSEWLLCSLLYPLAWRAIKRPLPERDRVST
jgi:O-antigen/teichoic acid export membrane protein